MREYNQIIIEEYISGREIQVAIMGDKKLGAIELKPKFSDAYNNLANILQRNGKLEEAKKNYQKGLSIDSKNKNILTSYGYLLLKLNKHTQGLKFINDGDGVIVFEQEGLKII